VLSVYLSVPEHPGELRNLAARADELIMAAEEEAGPLAHGRVACPFCRAERPA
jgi:hypothetical protein